MKQKFTTNNLLQFLYRETSASESLAIREALNNDWKLQEEYAALQASVGSLPRVKFSPSNVSIQNILNYSRTTAVTTQH